MYGRKKQPRLTDELLKETAKNIDTHTANIEGKIDILIKKKD